MDCERDFVMIIKKTQMNITWKMKTKKGTEYNYNSLTIVDNWGYFIERPVDEILDNNFVCWKKEQKIEFLNDFIRDIEHYRDNL